MNQYLYNYLGARGATAPDLSDRMRQYLVAEIVTLGGSDTGGTTDDLWQEYGKLSGIAAGKTTNELMMIWAQAKGSSGATWGDLMRNLP